jgi:hypothetical protein
MAACMFLTQRGLARFISTFTCFCAGRFALGVSVWAGLAVVQALFWSLVYPGLVEDKLAQFTDICSIANIRQDGAKNPLQQNL